MAVCCDEQNLFRVGGAREERDLEIFNRCLGRKQSDCA